MKLKNILPAIAAGFALSLAGCSKSDSPPPATAEATQKAAAPVADAMKQTADTAKAAAETVAADATKQVHDTVAASSAKAQELIDKAKSLITSDKLQEASSVLQQLAALKLTPEQQQLVDDLKAQLQKALAGKATSDAATAAGNLLKK